MTYTNKFNERLEATQKAQEILKAKGVYFPLPDRELSDEENHERIVRYAEQEAALVIQLLNKTSIAKPTDEVKPKKQWAPWADD